MAQRFPSLKMGMKNAGVSLDDEVFEDLKRNIYKLLEEDHVEEKISISPKQKTILNGAKEERKNYYVMTHSKIIESKNRFLNSCLTLNQKIDEISEKLMVCLTARELQLKLKLQQIAVERLNELDKQLHACEEVLKLINKSENSVNDSNELSFRSSEVFNKSLRSIEIPNIKFEIDSYPSIVRAIKSMGKVTYEGVVWNNPRVLNSNSVSPKIIFGKSGAEESEFCRPWGVCTDPTGRILICDRSNHRIQIFNEFGEFLHQFGQEGSELGEFNRPTGIATDKKCRIVVSDKDNHRVQIFTYSGSFLFSFGSQGTKLGEFMYPWDVAVAEDRIAVSDSKNHRIQLFDDAGRFIAVMNAQKMGILNPRLALKYFDSPRGLTFLSDKSLLVTDFNNHKILHINNSFNRVKWIGSEGTSAGQFFRPQGIAFDGSGKFAVADSKNYRIQVFDMDGNVLKTFGARGSDPGQFNCPQGICFHQNHNIIVVDLENNRIQVF